MTASAENDPRINLALLRTAIAHPNALASPELVPASDTFIDWLKQHSSPEFLIELFGMGVPADDWLISFVRLHSASSIMGDNEQFPRFLEQSLLIVGRGPNGDFIVIDLQDRPGTVGFVCWFDSAVWSDESKGLVFHDDLRSLFVSVSPSIGAFALGQVKDALPFDSYFTWSEDNDPDGDPLFDVVLTNLGNRADEVVKVVRSYTGLGLGPAKALVSSAPMRVMRLNQERALELQKDLQALGAEVEIRPVE